MTTLLRREAARGQALAVMAISLTTLLLAVAVTIDGGNAFQQQRAVQNGSDAASLAGAVVLSNYAACDVWSCAAPDDGDVKTAVDDAAAENDVAVSHAYYTDICGTPLQADGDSAVSGGSLVSPAEVGGGTIPPDRGESADCRTGATGPPRGVLVRGHRDAPTFIAGMIGISTFSIDAQATAVSTYGTCAASQGCGVLPIAFPVNITYCDNSGKAVDTGTPWVLDTFYIFPLCKKEPGNVGWLDVTGEGKQGLPDAITTLSNSPITTPSWQDFGLTGNMNTPAIEDALRAREGDTVRALQFDHTCGGETDSSFPIVNDPAQDYGCASDFEGGNGQNLAYRIPRILGFVLCSASMAGCPLPHDAYINGSNKDDCATGNGGTGCIVGKFVELGDAGTGNGTDSPVQLIK